MSIDVKMAWRNLWRHPRRTALTTAAIAFAGLLLIFMLSWQFGSYATMINVSVKIRTGHLQIQARGYREKKDIRQVVAHPASIARILEKIPQVAAFAYRTEAFSLVSAHKRTYGIMVTGIDPVQEARVSSIKSLIRKGSYLSGSDPYQALVGKLLARNLRVKIGDELTLLGQARDGSVAATVLKVKGIYSSGIDEFDRASIYIPLKTFQQVYVMQGAVHRVVIMANTLSQVPAVASVLRAELPRLNPGVPLVVLDWQQLLPGLRQSIEMDLVSGIIFYIILILVVAFSILNTFLMAIFERTREFGVLMAVGTSPGRLTKVLLIESMTLTAVGLAAGAILGSLVTLYFQVHGIDVAGSSELLSQFGISGRMYPRLSLLSVSCGPLAILVITFFAALYPALKVRKLRPVQAMRAV